MVPDYYFTVKEQRPESKRHLESRVIYFIQSNQCSALLHVTCPGAWSTQCVLTRHFTIIRMYVTMCQRSVPHSLIHFWNFGTLCHTSRLQVISTQTAGAVWTHQVGQLPCWCTDVLCSGSTCKVVEKRIDQPMRSSVATSHHKDISPRSDHHRTKMNQAVGFWLDIAQFAAPNISKHTHETGRS